MQPKPPTELKALSMTLPRNGGCMNPTWRYTQAVSTDVRKTIEREKERLAGEKRKADKALRTIS